jgi:predicted ATPase/class 3 adenylate cyclase
MMNCPNCHVKNPSNAKFCLECGRRLALVDYTQPRTYTPRFLADKILGTRTAIEGERKIVTVLFIDVADSTRIFEKLDPEEVHDIMDGCFKIAMDDIHGFEGTVNQFRGDGIMALFGAPIAHEDDAHRACSAAISIQNRLTTYSQKVKSVIGEDFRVRIGMNSGPVVVGSIGQDLRMDYTADGDTVNLAARLENKAAPGTILVSEATVERVMDDFEFQSLGRTRLKGKEKRQRIYRLMGHRGKPRPGLRRMIFSRMVGRDRELNWLELRVLKAKNGEGSIVNIIGDAGVGKSRLVAEQKKRETVQGTVVMEGRAHAMGRNLSYHPIIEILKTWADIHDRDTESDAIDKLNAAVRQIHPERADQIFPFLARMMGLKPSGRHADRLEGIEGEALEVLIHRSLMEIILTASEQTPLLFVIEDVHWADDSTINLLTKMFRLAKDRRILFINIFRPHHRNTADKLHDAIIENYPELHSEIYIQPLDATHCNMLIDNLLEEEGLPQHVRDLIYMRSEGNPFYIEELIRSFIDKGLVTLLNGKFRISGHIDAALIPSTVQELIMSRLDRLDDQTKTLLKIASVIGKTFLHKLLVEVADAIDRIDERLNYLEQVELIRASNRLGEKEYIFNHALVQSTAYESILRQTRKELHLQVAACTEKLYQDKITEFYGMLAFHYSIGEYPEKTEEYLIRAGEEALRSSASNEALSYYHSALDLYLDKYEDIADFEKMAMLEKNISIAFYNRGQYDEAVQYFDRALAYYWDNLPQGNIASATKVVSSLFHLIIALYFPGLKFREDLHQNEKNAVDLSYKKAKALTIINPNRFFFESLFTVGKITKFKLNDFEMGRQLFLSSSALFSFPGISFGLSQKIIDLLKDSFVKENTRIYTTYVLLQTVLHYLKGNWMSIDPFDFDLVDRNLDIGEIWDASQYLYWHGHLSIYTGSFEIAQSAVDKLSELFEDYQNEISISFKYELSIQLLTERRDLGSALDEIHAAIKKAPKMGLQYFLLELYSSQAQLYVFSNNYEKAESALGKARRILEDIDAIVPFQQSNFWRSQAIFSLHKLEESESTGEGHQYSKFRKAAAAATAKLLRTSQKAAQHRVEAHTLRGVYYWLTRRQNRALKRWRDAVKVGQNLNARPQLARAYLEIAKRLQTPQSRYKQLDGKKADAYFTKARVLFYEMNLQWDLKMLSKIRNS